MRRRVELLGSLQALPLLCTLESVEVLLLLLLLLEVRVVVEVLRRLSLQVRLLVMAVEGRPLWWWLTLHGDLHRHVLLRMVVLLHLVRHLHLHGHRVRVSEALSWVRMAAMLGRLPLDWLLLLLLPWVGEKGGHLSS